MNIAELMALSEAAGFSGGSASFVDEYPHMSLSECVAALPMFIVESQIEGIESTRQYNEAMVECAMESMRSGVIDESAVMELNEKGLDSIKTAVKNFFARIKKFIDSIVAKLKVAIDKIRLSGKQLWSKYGNDPDLKDTSKLKNLTYDGYKFAESSFKTGDFDGPKGAEDLIKAAYGGDAFTPDKAKSKFNDARKYTVDYKSGMSEREARELADKKDTSVGGGTMTAQYKKGSDEHLAAIDALIEKLGELSSKERSTKMAEALSGQNGLGEDWREELRKKLWGDKVTMTYGKDGFELKAVGELLSNPTDLDNVRLEYEKLRKSVGDYETDLNKDLDEYTKNSGDKNAASVINGKIASYYSKYMEAIKDAYGVITGIKGIRVDYERKKAEQARSMFGMMISAAKKKAKPDNNDVEIDEDLMFEI